MTGLLLALLATVLTGIGARDQTLIARLAKAQGQRVSALAAAFAVCCGTAALAAWAGAALATQPMIAWLALFLAGIEMLMIQPGRAPREPTHSLGAMAFVLAFYQVTDAARLLILALALMTASPVQAGIGGAIGGAITLIAGWLAPAPFTSPRIRPWRRLLGLALLLTVLGATLLHRL